MNKCLLITLSFSFFFAFVNLAIWQVYESLEETNQIPVNIKWCIEIEIYINVKKNKIYAYNLMVAFVWCMSECFSILGWWNR